MELIEQIIAKYLERYDTQALCEIEENLCVVCPFNSDDCFPCPRVDQMMLDVEEFIAARTAGEN